MAPPKGTDPSVMTRWHIRGLTALVCSLALGPIKQGWAQAIQPNQAQLTREQAPSAFPGATPPGTVEGGSVAAGPSDTELGEQQILKRVEEYQPFTISAGVPFYWTSNVALTRSGEQSDFVVAPVAAVFYEPRITNALYAFVDVREQLFYYDRFDNFDFGSFDVEVGLRYIVPQWHNLLLRAEYDYNRLTNKDSFSAFFQNHGFILNAEIPFRLGRAQQVVLGAEANISAAAEESGQAPPPAKTISARRNDYETYLGYSVALTRSFSVNAVGRIVVRDYWEGDRTDVSEILGLSATYRVNKYVSFSAVSSLAANQSNQSVFDYEVANVGGALALSVKF